MTHRASTITHMSYANIGGPITLGIIGAILAFAVSDVIEGVDLTTIGYILMAGAAIWLVLSLIFNSRSKSVRSTQATTYTDGGQVVERETREG